jgi:protein-disulfide isomerase
VRFVWKHFPLEMHEDAPAAHRASVAAHKQGKFWQFHDKLFGDQGDLTPEAFVRYAKELGLDVKRFEAELDGPDTQKEIDKDKAEARSMGMTGTPSFFINGRYLSGARPYEDFANMINAELNRLGIPLPSEAE